MIGFALGRHLAVEFSGCDPDIIANTGEVRTALLTSAERAGAHIVESSFHEFQPQGVSGFVIISESHFSIHTWPEFDYAAVDIFTCGDSLHPQAGIESLKKSLRARSVRISADMWRGTAFNQAETNVTGVSDGDMSGDMSKLFLDSSADAFSVSVDLRGCAGLSEKTLSECFRVNAEFLGMSGLEPTCQVWPERTVLSAFTGDSSLVIRSDRKLRTVFLELFSSHFFESRICAAESLRILSAKSYKIHPAFRMA